MTVEAAGGIPSEIPSAADRVTPGAPSSANSDSPAHSPPGKPENSRGETHGETHGQAHAEFAAGLDLLAAECLRWVGRYLDRFRLPDDVADPETDLNWTMKPLGELAQLSGSIRRQAAPDGPGRGLADELLGFCHRETDGGTVLLELFRAEPQASYPLEIYAAFAAAGLRHEGFERFARSVCATRGWRQSEQEPNRRLGVLSAERQAGLTPHGPFGEALRRTWLGGLPEPWTFERGAGYHLTHTVFHLTGWGERPDGLPPELADYLTDWLPCWLDGCLEAGQWDLCCELLAVGAALPEALPPEHTAPAWRRIAAARGPGGALPEAGPPVPAEDDRHFPHCYHSTLAAAFAATLTAARLRPAAGGREARP